MNQPCEDTNGPRFELGRITVTPAALSALEVLRHSPHPKKFFAALEFVSTSPPG